MSDTNESGSDARLDRFEAALAQIGHRPSSNDRRWAIGGLIAMAVGVLITVVAYVISTNQAVLADVVESVVLAGIGVAVVVAGAAVFVRYSLSEFLRFWMLRMLFQESEAPTSKES